MPSDFTGFEHLPGVLVRRRRHVQIHARVVGDAAMDADDAALHIEQRAAGVAHRNRAIGSNDGRLDCDHAPESDGRSAAGLEAAGVTQRKTPIARLGSLFAQRDRCERPRSLVGDLHQPSIDRRIESEGLTQRRAAVRKDDLHVAARPSDDMRGGHHISVGTHNHAAGLRPIDLKGDGRGENLLSNGRSLVLDGPQVGCVFGGGFAQYRVGRGIVARASRSCNAKAAEHEHCNEQSCGDPRPPAACQFCAHTVTPS